MHKVAIVTGASRGIGRAVALDLARQGYRLALVARDAQKLAALAENIKEQYVLEPQQQPIVFALDVADKIAVERAVAETIERFQRVDILFNNAGILHLGQLENSYDDFLETINVNLIGVFNFLYAVIPQMKQQRSGYIFNLSSMAGKIAGPNFSHYVASKFGVQGLSESLFLELKDHNIKVTALCPGFVATDMTASMKKSDIGIISANDVLQEEEKIQTADIVKTVNYLLSLSDAAVIAEVMLQCKAAI